MAIEINKQDLFYDDKALDIFFNDVIKQMRGDRLFERKCISQIKQKNEGSYQSKAHCLQDKMP